MATGRAWRAWAALGLVLLAGGPVTSCADSGTAGGAERTTNPARTTAMPAPRTTSREELCTRIVAYWSRRQLKGDTVGDYQEMGLSDGQYDILRHVVDAAHAERERGDAEAADRLIDRMAREGCEKWYRTGDPSNGPWG
ncbi:MAG: hypothetical protein HOY79_17350 [Streptomyces sp.]|nr:hypothetical protein [Streptomyces sp.]